jgi:hypothetical protein
VQTGLKRLLNMSVCCIRQGWLKGRVTGSA